MSDSAGGSLRTTAPLLAAMSMHPGSMWIHCRRRCSTGKTGANQGTMLSKLLAVELPL
jgi:hypothetical protein